MPRKLKTYQTWLGSYDQATCALDEGGLGSLGSNSNLRDGADGQALLKLIGTPLDDQGRSG